MQKKDANEIMELKKVQDHLIIEQVQMCARCGKFKQAVSKYHQHISENTTELTPVKKAKRLEQIIVQLQDNNLMLQAMVQPMTPLEQVAERKSCIEDIATKF